MQRLIDCGAWVVALTLACGDAQMTSGAETLPTAETTPTGQTTGAPGGASMDMPPASLPADPAPANLSATPVSEPPDPAAGSGTGEPPTPGQGDSRPRMAGDGAGESGVPGAAMEQQPDAGPGTIEDAPVLEKFSFFVTSLETMRELSDSQDGFGGNFGGLEGADSICQRAAEAVGFGAKQWRAFLSAMDGGDGQPVHAIDRIGEGPWYDRNGRLIAEDIAGLLQQRPDGDTQAVNDLPNEFGEGLQGMGDTHDVVTASDLEGQLIATDPANTCNDWTSTTVTTGGEGVRVQLGHSWPAGSGASWITAHRAHSCAAGVNLVQDGIGDFMHIGSGGGWGAIYCFALTP